MKKRNTFTGYDTLIYTLVAILIVFAMFFTWIYVNEYNVASAADIDSSLIRTTDPLDDLEGSIIGGKEFDISDYAWDVNLQPQVIYFAEIGYSIYANQMDDYALYIYVYNPSGLVFDDTVYNKIQMSFGSSDSYSKYQLELINYSTKSGYEGLFYKFALYLSDSEKTTILRYLDSTSRIYTVTGIELSVNSTVTEYTVAGTYTYTGYQLGYGSSLATESSLACTVENFTRYFVLDVTQTVYRPEGDYYDGVQSQLNTAIFTVPTYILEDYGLISTIKYEWYEYVTKPILVTEDIVLYDCLDELQGSDIDDLEGFYFLIQAWSNTDTAFWGLYQETDFYMWSNLTFQDSYTFTNGVWIGGVSFSNTDASDNFAAVFYTGSTSYEDYMVSGEDLQAKLIEYSQALGDTSIVDRYAAALFMESVQDGRTMGYNLAESDPTVTIYTNDTVKSFWQRIFGGYDVETTYETLDAFYYVSASDLVGTNAEIAARLYIHEDDVDALKERYYAAAANDETVVLFRFASTDYYAWKITSAYSFSSDDPRAVARESFVAKNVDENYTGYIAQETVFLNFDIISIAFTNEDGVTTVIPVVMSPQDVISGITPPLEEDYSSNDPAWWAYVIIVLAEIIVLLLLSLVLCKICNLPSWVMIILLVIVIVMDILFIEALALQVTEWLDPYLYWIPT